MNEQLLALVITISYSLGIVTGVALVWVLSKEPKR